AMREAGKRSASRAEFKTAVSLDPTSTEAHAAIRASRRETINELRVGNETDFLSYSAANHGNGAVLATRWIPVLGTSLGFATYQRNGVLAEKFTASATVHLPRWGALTAGGAVGHDNAV